MATAKSVFDLAEFKPYLHRYIMRRNEFLTRRRYYDGTIYQDSQFRLAHKLYAATKALFLPLARAVDLDVALIPGVMEPWKLDEDATPAQRTAQALLYRWSGWDVEADTWLEDGCTMGEGYLKVVPNGKMVQLQRLDPALCLMTKHVDPESQEVVELVLIVDPQAEGASGEIYEYAEAITPGQIRTYRNGAPWGFDGRPDRWENPLGLAPVVGARHDAHGRPTFAKCLPQLDSVNELASYLADIIGRHAEPQWAAIGVEQGELTRSGSNVWYLPAGADIKAILATIDVAGTLEFIKEIGAEMKASLPELAFDDLRVKDQIAAETLKVQLIELYAKVWKCRRRYDAALVEAHHLAALVAGMMGIGGLEALLDPHEVDDQRPVLPESRLQAIEVEQAELALEAQRQLLTGESMTNTAVAPQTIAEDADTVDA